MPTKPLYMPNEEDIYNLNEIKKSNDINHVDIYGYIIAKTIEKLINDAKFLKNADSYILDIPEIVHGLCWVYPQEVFGNDLAKTDIDLCRHLIIKEKDKSIYNLDMISMFDESVQSRSEIMELAIEQLDEKQLNSPEYRFSYKGSNLLDTIYGVDYEKFADLSYSTLLHLMNIDPIYSLKFDYKRLIPEFHYVNEEVINWRRSNYFSTGFSKYRKLYDLREHNEYEYDKIDYHNPSDEKVKRLLKNLYK